MAHVPPLQSAGEVQGSTCRFAVWSTLKDVSRIQFFAEMPWVDNAEALYTRGEFVYPDGVFDLRSRKLRIMSQLIDAVGPHRVKLVHLDRLELSPVMFMRSIAKEFGMELNDELLEMGAQDNIRQVTPRGSDHLTMCLNNEEWWVAQSKIDWELEARFSFGPLDCHTCLSEGVSQG